MNQCEACEGTGTVRAVSPRTGKREETMPKETCPECGGVVAEPEGRPYRDGIDEGPEPEPEDKEEDASDEDESQTTSDG